MKPYRWLVDLWRSWVRWLRDPLELGRIAGGHSGGRRVVDCRIAGSVQRCELLKESPKTVWVAFDNRAIKRHKRKHLLGGRVF